MIGSTRDEVRGLCSPLLTAAKRVGLEVNEDKAEYLVVSRTRQDNASLDVDDFSFKKVEEFVHPESSVTNDNDTNYEVNARIQSGSRCLHPSGPYPSFSE